MLEVNYRCSQCRPFTSDAPCTTCLESRLEISKYIRDFKSLHDIDPNEKRDGVLSLFSEDTLATAEDLAA